MTDSEAREKYPNLMRVAHEVNTFPEPYKVADKLLAVAKAAGDIDALDQLTMEQMFDLLTDENKEAIKRHIETLVEAQQ